MIGIQASNRIFDCLQTSATPSPSSSTCKMRKQLDPRIPILINNNVKLNHRSFIVLVGDKGRDQVRAQAVFAQNGHLRHACRSSTFISCSLKLGCLPGLRYYGATRKTLGLRRTLFAWTSTCHSSHINFMLCLCQPPEETRSKNQA